jgi:long-chain fatty acid transport protein
MNKHHSFTPAMRQHSLHLLLVLGGVALSPIAQATNGYFPHGFGVQSKGMAGAGVAIAQDGFAGANNPAQAAFAGAQMQVGGEIFSPKRDMRRSGSPMPGLLDTAVSSGRTAFLIPEFGYNAPISNNLAVGLTVYGQGGMNTSYAGGQTMCADFATMTPMPGMNALCGMGKLGVDLMQLIIAPTVAYKLNDHHAIGVSPLLVYQQFEAYGLHSFQMMPNASSNPSKLTNNGKDSSTGFGVRLGYMGKLSDQVSVGASFTPKISMSRLDKYAGLFADGGKFDIPAHYTVGMAFQVTPTVQIAADYNRINYSKVPSIGNPAGFGLGLPNGGGFGWKDVETVKLGVQWKMNAKTTLRFGVNRGTNPVTGPNITPNILAPGVMKTHLTIGGTYALSDKSELSWAFMHAPSVSVTGPSMFNQMAGTGTAIQETVKMRQNAIAIQYSWKF